MNSREHANIKIREILSAGSGSDESEMLKELKKNEEHKPRILSEAAISKQAVINRMSNPAYVFSSDYWRDVAQLATTGQIDPNNMQPLFAPKTAQGLARLSHIHPGAVRKVGKVLQGIKKASEVFQRGRKETGIASPEEAPQPSTAMPQIVRGMGPRRAYGRIRHVTVELPPNISMSSSRRYQEFLQDVLYRKLHAFGDLKSFINALEKLKK